MEIIKKCFTVSMECLDGSLLGDFGAFSNGKCRHAVSSGQMPEKDSNSFPVSYSYSSIWDA